MQIQTVFRAGNSDVVALPKSLGFKSGDKVTLEKISDGEDVLIKKATKSKVSAAKTAVSSEFKKWLKEATKEDAEILDQLA